MTKKKEQIQPEPEKLPDPYTLLRQNNKQQDLRIAALEKQVGNLQETWERILQVRKEPALVIPEPKASATIQRILPPWEEQPPSLQQEEILEPILEQKEPKALAKSSKKKTIIVAGSLVAIMIILVLAILYSKGYSCALLPH